MADAPEPFEAIPSRAEKVLPAPAAGGLRAAIAAEAGRLQAIKASKAIKPSKALDAPTKVRPDAVFPEGNGVPVLVLPNGADPAAFLSTPQDGSSPPPEVHHASAGAPSMQRPHLLPLDEHLVGGTVLREHGVSYVDDDFCGVRVHPDGRQWKIPRKKPLPVERVPPLGKLDGVATAEFLRWAKLPYPTDKIDAYVGERLVDLLTELPDEVEGEERLRQVQAAVEKAEMLAAAWTAVKHDRGCGERTRASFDRDEATGATWSKLSAHRCQSHRCWRCAQRKALHWQARVRHQVLSDLLRGVAHHYVFLTLTEDRKAPDYGPALSFRTLLRRFDMLVRWLRREYGDDLAYIRVIEGHKDGYPHVHVLIRSEGLANAMMAEVHKGTGGVLRLPPEGEGVAARQRRLYPLTFRAVRRAATAPACGFGRRVGLELVRAAGAMPSELAKTSQIPRLLPRSVRRFAASGTAGNGADSSFLRDEPEGAWSRRGEWRRARLPIDVGRHYEDRLDPAEQLAGDGDDPPCWADEDHQEQPAALDDDAGEAHGWTITVEFDPRVAPLRLRFQPTMADIPIVDPLRPAAGGGGDVRLPDGVYRLRVEGETKPRPGKSPRTRWMVLEPAEYAGRVFTPYRGDTRCGLPAGAERVALLRRDGQSLRLAPGAVPAVAPGPHEISPTINAGAFATGRVEEGSGDRGDRRTVTHAFVDAPVELVVLAMRRHASGVSLGHARFTAVLEQPGLLRRELDSAVQLLRDRTDGERQANTQALREVLERFPVLPKKRNAPRSATPEPTAPTAPDPPEAAPLTTAPSPPTRRTP